MDAITLVITSIVFALASCLAHGIIATLIAFFWKRPARSTHLSAGRVLRIWFSTWVFVTFVASCALYLLIVVGASDHTLSTLGNLLIPVIAGIWFARVRFTHARARLNA